MRLELSPHPSSSRGPAERIEVAVSRSGSRLDLVFTTCGDMASLRFPGADSGRTDGLWGHTCFEAFVRVSEEDSYWELNLAPSGQWAAYAFSDYRKGMAHADLDPPTIQSRIVGGRHELVTQCLLTALGAPDATWSLGLSAVLEDVAGDRSYWALTHPAEAPDFHHPDSMTLTLRDPDAA